MQAGRWFRNVANAIAGRGDYTQQVIAEAEDRGFAGDRRAAIFEAVASGMERAFAQGRLSGGSAGMRAAVSPGLLAQIGRALVDRGEWVAEVDRLPDDRWHIRPAASWEILNPLRSADPENWQYKMTTAVPTAQVTRTRPRSMVAHVVTRASQAMPYQGRGLWGQVANTADAVAASENRLREELAAVTGQVLTAGGTMTGTQTRAVKDQLKRLRGGMAIVGYNSNLGGKDGRQLGQLRIGPNPPEQLGVLRGQSAELIALAAGLPGSFVRGGRGSEQRESLRVFLFATLLPLAGLVSHELARVFGDDAVSLEFSRLTAADLSGRARAVKQLTDAGVPLQDALGLAGFQE